MTEYDAYRSAELAELYDAVYADFDDHEFWQTIAEEAPGGPHLELACGTGRLLLPLARAGHEVAGIDLAPHMLERCRAKLGDEPAEVRGRVTLAEADMTAFSLGRRFASVLCAFGSFHHLRTAEAQLACLARCREHLLPGGRLVLDLINPDPAPAETAGDAHGEDPTSGTSRATGSSQADGVADGPDGDLYAGTVEWTQGRRVRSWATVVGSDRSQQTNDCEVTYEVIERDGTTRVVTETFPMRFIFRYELVHLLARAGFRIVDLYGDYDRSGFADGSLGMIAVAEPFDLGDGQA